MGAVLTVHHLAVVSAGFFATLAATPTQLVQPWDGPRDPISYFAVRHFVRAGEAVERRLPVASVESINRVHEQQLFALAAVRAGIGGPQMLRDLTLCEHGQSTLVPQERREDLAEMLNRLAALPKTRVRLPGGVQHLLADPVEYLLQQTDELNSAMVQLDMAGYVPVHTDLSYPNARLLPLDQFDVQDHQGPLPVLVLRDRVEGIEPPSPALAFSQLRCSGAVVFADLAQADALPRTRVFMRGGAEYLVTNLPEAIEHTLANRQPPAFGKMVTRPARVFG